MRYLWTLLRTLFHPKVLSPLDEIRLPLIVWPWNCDTLNFHLNNGDYIYLCDLGRIQLMCRSKLWKVFWKFRCRPVVGGLKVRYLKSLLPFQRLILHTQVKSWDEKWIYIEHTLSRHDAICARIYIQACFKNRQGIVPFKDVAEELGAGHVTPPPLPPEWNFKLSKI